MKTTNLCLNWQKESWLMITAPLTTKVPFGFIMVRPSSVQWKWRKWDDYNKLKGLHSDLLWFTLTLEWLKGCGLFPPIWLINDRQLVSAAKKHDLGSRKVTFAPFFLLCWSKLWPHPWLIRDPIWTVSFVIRCITPSQHYLMIAELHYESLCREF